MKAKQSKRRREQGSGRRGQKRETKQAEARKEGKFLTERTESTEFVQAAHEEKPTPDWSGAKRCFLAVISTLLNHRQKTMERKRNGAKRGIANQHLALSNQHFLLEKNFVQKK